MFPVGDFLRTRTRPVVNWTLIGINVAVFLYSWLAAGQTQPFFFDWGFVPACVATTLGFDTNAAAGQLAVVCPDGNREYLQILTSMFVHAGPAHILGNMFFLWIFGDNVEDRMGHLRYLLFYFICGIAASATQTFMSIDTLVPSVGASGAIAGVLGAYLVLHPTARVQVIILPLFFIPFFIPAALLIGFWFVMQLFSGFLEMGQATAGSGVAWWAHIGGFVAGAALIWLFKGPKRRDRVFAGTY